MPSNTENTASRIGDLLFLTNSNNAIQDADSSYFTSLYVTGGVDYLPDRLRTLNGAFWTMHDLSPQQLYKKKFPDLKQINVELLGEPNVSESPYSREERYRISFTGQAFDADMQSELLRNWRNTSRIDGEIYYDHTTIVNAYEQGTNSSEETSGIENHYFETKADYNFLEARYEELLNESQVNERILPNFYAFVLKDQATEKWNNFLSLRGRIGLSNSQTLADPGTLAAEKFKPVSSYYNLWSKNYPEYERDENFEEDLNNISTIKFSQADMEAFSEIYKYKELFPFFVTNEFTTDTNTALGNLLERTNFFEQFYRNLNSNGSSEECIEVLTSIREGSGEKFNTKVSSKQTTFYDMQELFDAYTPGALQSTIFSMRDELDDSEYRAYYNLMSIIVRGKIAKMSKSYTRTYKEILDGKTAYNETILYILRKYDTDGSLVQSFIFPNTSKVDVIKHVDTQVHYDKDYKYTLSSQNIIFGTKYHVTGGMTYSNTHDIDVHIETSPSIKVAEFLLFEKNCVVRDNPPIAPDINLVPFKGVNNKIRFLLNSSVGRNMLEPIIFTSDETEAIQRYRVAQDVPEIENKILYESDDKVEKFYLYKMDTAPLSYLDFQTSGEKIEIIAGSDKIEASSSSYDDEIVPNRKYYYCVRSEDYHGNISYPTYVVQVELKSESGSTYPVIKEYEFKEPDTKQSSLGVKRFVRVSANLENLFADTTAMGLDSSEEDGPYPGQEVHLGITDDPVWNKKFKIRLTSKSTGRKIDFNFKMKTRTLPRVEDF